MNSLTRGHCSLISHFSLSFSLSSAYNLSFFPLPLIPPIPRTLTPLHKVPAPKCISF